MILVLPRWKEYRWRDWAVKHGLWEPIETPESIKYCKIISNLRKVSDDPSLDRAPSLNAQAIKKSVEIIDKHKGKGKGKGKEKKSKKDKSKILSSDQKLLTMTGYHICYQNCPG